MNDHRDHRNTMQLYAAIFLLVVGCCLLIAGFVVAPPGEIHNSVLIAFGEILTWSGSMFGMKYYFANRGQPGHRDKKGDEQ